MNNWVTAFGLVHHVPAVISEALTDTSYKNDMWPSFMHPAHDNQDTYGGLPRLWVENYGLTFCVTHNDVTIQYDTPAEAVAGLTYIVTGQRP